MNKICIGLVVSAFACGSVNENRHLDAGQNPGIDSSNGNIDAPPSGPPVLTMEPLTKEFGPVAINASSSPVTVTFRNTGGDPATGCSAPVKGGANPGDFVIMNDTCGTADLMGGATCTVSVVARPTGDGLKTMTLSRTCTAGGKATTTSNGYSVNRPMFIFVTATEYNGNYGGLAGADAKCAAAGAAGSISGPKVLKWKALISQKTGTQVDAKDRFVWTGPIYDISGTIVTFDPSVWPWVGVTNGSTIRQDENGGIAGSYTYTATSADGTAQAADCNAWTADTNASFGRAGQTGNFPAVDWIDSFTSGCADSIFSLYCVSQ